MDTADQSSTVQVPSSNPTPALVQAGQVGLAFLRNTGQEQKNQAFQIFCEMATAAVKYGAQHTNIEYESSALKERIAPNSGKAASAWLSPLWKQLEEAQEHWREGMTAVATELKAEFVPQLKKLAGSPAKYLLVAEPIEPSSQDRPSTPTPPGGLRYTPAAVAAPGSTISAGLRSGVLHHTASLIAMSTLLVATVLLLVVVPTWWLINSGLRLNTVPTVAHFTLIGSWAAITWVGVQILKFLARLGDLGIVMAPDILVPFKEDHVTLELRPRNDERRGEFAFVRYTAVCPLCAGKVVLHDGGTEFHGRIVGRCRESPREHVFSFDQKLHVGKTLRPENPKI